VLRCILAEKIIGPWKVLKKIQFEKNEVRTADINPILLKIVSVNKGYKGNKKRDKSQKNDLPRFVHESKIPWNQNFIREAKKKIQWEVALQ